ncbi:hypothetical protein [Shewanella algae]|nr:hypothetical protein [Shewanella algae]
MMLPKAGISKLSINMVLAVNPNQALIAMKAPDQLIWQIPNMELARAER